MTQAEKLEALVQRGFDRAWEFDNLDKWQFKAVKKTGTVRTDWWQVVFTYRDNSVVIDAERILYDHLFARALFEDMKVPKSHEATDDENALDMWGEVLGLYSGGGFDGYGDRCIFHGEAWQYHLQQAVISDDPIGYMYAVVFGE